MSELLGTLVAMAVFAIMVAGSVPNLVAIQQSAARAAVKADARDAAKAEEVRYRAGQVYQAGDCNVLRGWPYQQTSPAR